MLKKEEKVVLVAIVSLKGKYYYIVSPIVECYTADKIILKEGYVDYDLIQLQDTKSDEPEVALGGEVTKKTPDPEKPSDPEKPNEPAPASELSPSCNGFQYMGDTLGLDSDIGIANFKLKDVSKARTKGAVYVPGNVFRERRETLKLAISATNAAKFTFKSYITRKEGAIAVPVSSINQNSFQKAPAGQMAPDVFPPIDVEANSVKVSSDKYLVSFDKLMPPNDWFNSDLAIEIKVTSLKGEVGTKECKVLLNLVSPIVLDFSVKQEANLLLTQFWQNKVLFDLDNSGVKKQTGWIKGNNKVAFLALDLNNNGLIDNGGELFGNYTSLKNGTYPTNGYQALADLDELNQGFISKDNRIYDKLLLWYDLNGDAVSQPSELFSLAQKGVLKISTLFQEVPHSFNSEKPFANQVKYSSSFLWMHNGTLQVKNTYDVFFAIGN